MRQSQDWKRQPLHLDATRSEIILELKLNDDPNAEKTNGLTQRETREIEIRKCAAVTINWARWGIEVASFGITGQ